MQHARDCEPRLHVRGSHKYTPELRDSVLQAVQGEIRYNPDGLHRETRNQL